MVGRIQEVLMNYLEFKKEWSGRSVDYDKVYSKQCVDLILQYVYECYGLGSGIWGNAIDYWTHTSPPLLTKFDMVSTTDCRQGDIVVLYGLSGNPYGHIGICDSQSGGAVQLLEQNAVGGGDGSGRNAIGVYRDIPKSRIAGVLRPKSAPVPPPAPAPARQTVFLPGSVQSWRLYRVGSGLRPNTSDQIAVLAPAAFGGLTYKIVAWVGDYAVVIDTQMYGRGTIWIAGTSAVIR
jgi:CHAP domain